MAPLTRLPFVAAGIDAVMARSERRLMDEAAFQAFYSRTAGPVFGYLRRLTGNAAAAEDLLQDAYVRFLAASRLPEDDEHRKNYLYRIATNLARDRFRREKTESDARGRNDAGGRFRGTSYREMTPGVVPSATGAFQDATDTWSLLSRLSPRDRELLVLAYVEEMTHKEIAGVTGLMRASVKPLLFRARRRFAALLNAAGLGPVDRRSS
jgi:RNA polymerase sigma-70 factor (ECF subfamily)